MTEAGVVIVGAVLAGASYGARIGTPDFGAPHITWRIGGSMVHGAAPVPPEHMGDLERILVTMHSDARPIQLDRSARMPLKMPLNRSPRRESASTG